MCAFLLVCLFFCGFLNKTVMVLGMRECCLFFPQSRELGAGPLHFEKWSLESLNFHVVYEFKPQCDHNSSCTSARKKQAYKQQNKHSPNWVFYRCCYYLCFTQGAWCSHGPSLNDIKYAEQSPASRDCYRSFPTIKFLISDYYQVHMLLFPCHLHRKYVFGDSIPTGK